MPRRILLWLTLYAIAMANVEAVLVVYLRDIYYPDDPVAIFPLTFLSDRDLLIETSREIATLVMIAGVAVLTAKRLVGVFAAFVFVFGVWDVFYYAWLKLIIGWPVTWLGWDVLFLIPWPWLGPWIAAALVALLFAVWGGWILGWVPEARFSKPAALAFVSGASLVLVSFLAPAFPLLSGGEEAFQGYQPDSFFWALYWPGYALMTGGLSRVGMVSRVR